MANKKSIGLPGGPNEFLKEITQHISVEGYKRYSKDINNPYNIIESGNITMEDVDFPVKGTDNLGNEQIMMPGMNYQFPGDRVLEVPLAQAGTEVPRATISQYVEPAWYEKALDYLASPMTALSYIAQGKDLPDRLPINAENRNAYDMVIDMINPAAMIKYGAQAKRDYDNEEYLNSAFNTLGALPIVPAVLSKGKNVVKGGKNVIKNVVKSTDDAVKSAYKYNPLAYNNIDSKLPEILQLNKNNEKWLRQVGKPAIVDAQTTRTVREIGEKIDPRQFALKLAELKNAPLGQFSISKRYPGPFFKKGETFFKYNKKAKPGLDGRRNTRGRSGSSDYLIEFDPSDPIKYKGMDSYFQPAYMQIMQTDPKPFSKWVGDIGIMKPAMREVDNFNFYKKDWLRGYKQTPLDKLQDGNGEYKVASGDTFYGIANKNKIPWEALKEANPNLDYENLKLGQQLVLPNKIDRSPPIPKTGVSKNSNVLDYNALSNYLVDTRGGTVDTWGQLADTIAYHESSPWSRMDPKAKQYQGGPGRGLFQFEGESFDTALKRYKNVADAKGFTIKDSIVNAKSADQLSSEDQYALFLANLIESKTKLSDFVDGNISSLDVWLTGHKNVEADGDRDSFLESKKAAEKEGIKNGYKTFQYGNGEERYAVAQDNTRVVIPRYNVSPSLDFKKNTALQDFLADANPNQVNDTLINERRVAQDNTSIANDTLKVPSTLLPDSGPMSELDFEKLMQDISEEEKLIDTPYNSPNLTADFIKKSNEYSRGWKDMSEASEKEIQDLQAVLLEKGYDIGKTGTDGVYGPKTYQAHEAMVDDLNLNPTAISRYHKKYSIDTEKEVMSIQQKLVDEGYLSPTLTNRNASSVDGKFGDQTKEALDAYNTANTQEDPQAQVFNFIPSKLDETRCAAGMCTILEGNEVMTEALGVKYKDAWDIFENMDKSENSNTVFNIYDDAAFQNVNSAADLKRVTKEVKRRKQTKASDYEIGDIVGLYWDGSSHHQETLNSKTHNTHSGFVSDVVDGIPIITHNVNGSVLQQPYNELVTGWIKRPNENLEIKSRYNVDGIEDIEVNDLAIQNLAFRYSSSDGKNVEYQGARLEQLQNIFKRTKYNSLKIPEILNSSVDPSWLESTVIGITGVETGVGSSVPRSRDDVTTGTLKNVARGVAYDIKGKEDEDISLGIGKTKLASLDPFAKKYFDINSVEDFKDDNKGLDAITYTITKNYELFKDYAKEYPKLGLTETDIRNMSILAYNQGSNRLLKTGRVDDNRSSSEEVKALRELYDATLSDVNSTNYKYIPGVGQQVFDIAQSVGLEKPADSYIKKVNSYRSDLFPELFAVVEENTSPFEMSSMAQGGEYGVYNNYIYGKYDGTPREKSAAKLYDKLNVKHYKKAKQEGMTVPNYIISKVIKQTDN